MNYQVCAVILAICNYRARPVIGADILAFFPLPIYSHFSGFNPLFLELANRGHNVTVVSAFQSKGNVPPTYVHVPVTNVKIQRTVNPLDIRKSHRIWNMINVKRNMMGMVTRTLVLKEIRDFLNDTKSSYDMVLCECWYSDVYLALSHRYSAPVACLSPMMPSVSLSSTLGIPYSPSYVPSFWLRYTDVMSFAERLYNAAIAAAEMFMSNFMLRGSEQRMLDGLYDYPGHERCPPLDELKGRVSLTLVNSHLSVSYARPYPPNAVSVAGMHMQPVSASKIDPSFKKLLDGATDGVIYFSFGSNVKTADLPTEHTRTFVESFRKLRQTVLWKWENGTIDNLPGNVHVSPWFPQQYILSHRNCKMFITHGGYHSLVEALHFEMPVIGFPLYTDQYYNMRFTMQNGFGIEILLDELNQNVLDDAIGKILIDTSFKKNVLRASRIFKDLPLSALDNAVFWVEHAIRNGISHKSSHSVHHLSWYQFFLLDVITGILICAISTILFVKYIYKTLFNKYFKN